MALGLPGTPSTLSSPKQVVNLIQNKAATANKPGKGYP
jgi:hypothetical protein